jgi:hypothetical protein
MFQSTYQRGFPDELPTAPILFAQLDRCWADGYQPALRAVLVAALTPQQTR